MTGKIGIKLLCMYNLEQQYIEEAKQPIMAGTGERPDNVTIKTDTDYKA